MVDLYRIGIIGCGNMGGAIAEAVLKNGLIAPEDLFLNDNVAEKARTLALRTGAHAADLGSLTDSADLVVLAVKPQDLEVLAPDLRGSKARRFLSVMAGRTIGELKTLLGEDSKVARVMPNMAATVLQSVSAVSFSDGFDMPEKVERLLSAMGEVITLDEPLMDAATAVSGSGPAYFFYFAECMVSSAVDMGFTEEQARKLVLGTFAGSSEILKRGDQDLTGLIERVSSKGGTTEAALDVLKREGLEGLIKKAVAAARDRAAELSGGK